MPFDLWLERRLRDGRDDTWLADHSPYAAPTFCRLLGTELLRLEKSQERDETEELRAARAAGFAVAQGGGKAIRSALGDLADLATGPHDEPRKAFGNLFSSLSRDYVTEDGFATFRDLLRDRILDTWPVAAGDVVVGAVQPERRLHSLSSAARETGLAPSLLEKFLVAAGAIAEDDDRPTARKTFDAHRYSPLLEEVLHLVGPIEMQNLMGASKLEVKSLAEDEVLVPRTALASINSPWHPADGLKLVADLQANAATIEVDDESWERIQHAKNRTGLRIGAIINAIRQGSLLAGCRPEIHGYQAITVKKDEIDLLANRAGLLLGLDVTSMSAFGRSIGLRETERLVALVFAGDTSATLLRFPESGGERFCMTKADIEAFHRRFVTVSTLVGESGEHWNTILLHLKESGVCPCSPGGEDFGHLYLREDVEHAFRSGG